MSETSLLDRLKSWKSLLLRDSDNGRGEGKGDLPDLKAQMRECLEGKGGELSARGRAAALGRSYLAMEAEGRGRFLHLLATDFGPDAAKVDQAARALLDMTDPAMRPAAEQALKTTLEAPRLRLLTQFTTLPEGVKFLVDLRAELLEFVKAGGGGALQALESDLKGLLASWFDLGFLELSRITWHSPAAVLEKIMEYEAVHAIHSWADLKNRLDSDRRLYAFFHPRMPDEPLIFVEVALVKGMADNVQILLDQAAPVDDPHKADTAIFYSISNAQKGLTGISFGNFLIKKVVDSLVGEFPNLKHFATLSPLPGFRRWLDGVLAEGEAVLTPAEQRALVLRLPDQRGGEAGKEPLIKIEGKGGVLAAALSVPDWRKDAALAELLRAPLTRLAARYLAREKGKGGRALDPVAHFHLSNGARVERLNWLADVSPKGLAQSAGLMVNYAYRLSEIEANHEAYSGKYRVALSKEVKNWAEE